MAREIEERVLADVKFPARLSSRVSGRVCRSKESRGSGLCSSSVMAFLAILLVLYIDFQSWRLALLMIVSLPVALLGGVAGTLRPAASSLWARW